MGTAPTRSGPSFKRLTDAELLMKRDTGLCSRSNEKYSISHRRKQRELHVLVLQEDEDRDTTTMYLAKDEPREESVELSVNSMVGLTPSRTMKVRAHVGAQEVIVLVDSSASHNFISTELVRKLSLPLTNTANYGVLMGTGLSAHGKGICKGVVLTLPTIKVIDDFLPLQLGSSNIILGMQWLASIGGM